MKINRKIVFSALSIAATLGIVGSSVFAQLSSTAQAQNITFQSEIANLKIAKDSGPSTINNTANFQQFQVFGTPHNVFPGYNQDFTFWLWNNSGQDIPLSTAVSLGTTTYIPVSSNDLNNNLNIGFNCVDKGITGSLNTPSSSNTDFPLSAWTPGNENLVTLQPGEFAFCTLNASVPTNVTSMFNPENVSFNAIFTGTQVEPTGTPSPTPLQ